MSTDAPKMSWADDEEDDDLSFKPPADPPADPQPTLDKPKDTASTADNADGEADETLNPTKSNIIDSQYEVAVTLADMQGNPDSPLYSIKNFTDLGIDDQLLRGLYTMRFSHPSKIQERALPLLLANPPTNMIGQSQSGTGKTAAFVLTMLSRVDMSVNKVQALCLTPSRELARQILTVVQSMGEFTPVKTQYAVPQVMEKGQKIDAHIVVGTPGTVMDCIKRRLLPTQDILVFVLDEADNMLDQQGLGDQCLRVKNQMPKTAQIVLFSATFPDQVKEYADKFAPNANKITLKQEELTVKGIKQLYMDCNSEEHKYEIILKLYSLMTVGSSIVFVKRRDTASELERRLKEDGHYVVSLHGAYDGASRDKVIDDFRFGRAKVLITTNVLARGIDVATTSLVINYDIPTLMDGSPDYETYLHRIGRTGRFGRQGISISFVHDRQSWEQMSQIQKHFDCTMTRIDTSDWETLNEGLKKILKEGRGKLKQQYKGVGAAV